MTARQSTNRELLQSGQTWLVGTIVGFGLVWFGRDERQEERSTEDCHCFTFLPKWCLFIACFVKRLLYISFFIIFVQNMKVKLIYYQRKFSLCFESLKGILKNLFQDKKEKEKRRRSLGL